MIGNNYRNVVQLSTKKINCLKFLGVILKRLFHGLHIYDTSKIKFPNVLELCIKQDKKI